MPRDERDFRRSDAPGVSGTVRSTRRQLLATIALAAVALKWPRPATAQLRDCSPATDAQRAGLPYRDLDYGCAATRMGRVVIEEFFTYDSADCFALNAELPDWQRALPSNADLVRVPATDSAVARLRAQAFYAATRLGKLDQLHTALYEAVQRDRQRLDSVAALAALFESFGVERDAFASEINSVEVYINVDRAAHQSRWYGVATVPALVIGSRYLTTPEIAGSVEAMLAVAADRVAALGQ